MTGALRKDDAGAAPGGAANIQGKLHVNGNLGTARDQYPRRKRKTDKDVGDGNLLKAVQTLYVHRPVMNADEIHNWFKSQGFPTVLPPEEMHVTIAFSKTPFETSGLAPLTDTIVAPAVKAYDSHRFIVGLGENHEVAVQRFECAQLGARWREFLDVGASWDWPNFQPHLSISWAPPDGFETTTKPWLGQIVFGPEVFGVVKENWADDVVEKREDDVVDQAAIEKSLGADADAGAWIHDFVHSSNAKFKDKSKEARIRMALGAYYANKRAGTIQITDDEVQAWVEKLAKVGARHSKSDVAVIQKMHDHAVDLGAHCRGAGVGHATVDEDGQFYSKARIVKVDDTLGLVLGYAIVCKVGGTDYYDLNVDPDGTRVPEHITEGAMMKAAMDFGLNSRVGNEMHGGADKGTYPFIFPMTGEIAKSLGITTPVTGLLVGFFPSKDVLAKFVDGTYTGFSIEGRRVVVEEHE